jgi:hypothetical protein
MHKLAVLSGLFAVIVAVALAYRELRPPLMAGVGPVRPGLRGPSSPVIWLLCVALIVVGAIVVMTNRPSDSVSMSAQIFWGIALAAVLAPLICTLVDRPRGPALLFAALLLPFAAQLAPYFIIDFHGLFHAGIVYELLLGGSPPENSLMAGEPLHYMYGHHALIAMLMPVVPISPTLLFVLSSVVAMAVFALTVHRAAGYVSDSRAVRALAVLFALTATNPFLADPLREVTARVLLAPFDNRPVPFYKFMGVNTNQLGIALFGLAILGLLRCAQTRRWDWVAFGLLLFATFGSAATYPPAWSAILAAGGAAVVALWWTRRSVLQPATFVVGIAVVAGTLAGLPWILDVMMGKSGSSGVAVLPTLRFFVLGAFNVAAFLAIPVLVSWLCRDQIRHLWRQRRDTFAVLLACSVACFGAYLTLAAPGQAEYKFLICSSTPLACWFAVPFHALLAKARSLGVAIVFVLLLPPAVDHFHLWVPRPVSDHLFLSGRAIRHTDEEQDRLYTWIRESTPTRSVFIDSWLTIPALGQRGLFVGLDLRREEWPGLGTVHDGYFLTADEFLTEYTGVDLDHLAHRRTLALQVLGHAAEGPNDQTFEQIKEAVPGRAVFAVFRGPEAMARASQWQGLERVYQTANVAVYQIK